MQISQYKHRFGARGNPILRLFGVAQVAAGPYVVAMNNQREVKTRIVDLVFPNQTNHLGTLFGGHALALMDKAASVTAHRYACNTVVTASLDRIDFLTPVYEGELVEVIANVVHTGRTSMLVQAELWAENLITGERRLCTTGKFTMVALDSKGKPTPVPPIQQST